MREAYHDQLDSIVDDLVDMADSVAVAVHAATRALLGTDGGLAEQVIGGDRRVDDARELVEDKAFELLVRQQPVAGELRMLVAALRMVGDLERIGDLAVHIAKVSRMRMPGAAVPVVCRGTISTMGTTAEAMVREAGAIVADRDATAALALEQRDDDMDQLQRALFHSLLGGDWSYGVEPAIDVALLGRYYERIADHAVSMARRVVYLVTGQRPLTTSGPGS